MADKISPERRSKNMAAIRSQDTKPELVVRKLLHGMGYRYRLHRKDLPGKPDIVFGSRKKIIFVHGCFWHCHSDKSCPARLPKSNTDYWSPKLRRNKERDAANIEKLRAEDWQVEIVWECQTADTGTLAKRLVAFMEK